MIPSHRIRFRNMLIQSQPSQIPSNTITPYIFLCFLILRIKTRQIDPLMVSKRVEINDLDSDVKMHFLLLPSFSDRLQSFFFDSLHDMLRDILWCYWGEDFGNGVFSEVD